jgi:glycosyltransferase involved in cell wall biosynthesis
MMLPKLAERLPDNYKLKVIAGAVGGYQVRNYHELLEKFHGKPYSNKIESVINCPYDRIVDYYLEAASSGCYLSTSYNESFGMTVLEAMASACPMVLSNLTAFKEVAGDSALYFNSDDIDACLNSILTICEDSSVRATMLSKTKDIYELNFNPIKICSDYVSKLQSIMD